MLALGRSCTIYECDLNKRSDVLAIIPHICIEEKIEIDILVNCGGVSHRSPAVDYSDEKWDQILQVNLSSAFQLSRALATHWFNTSLSNFIDAGPSSATPKKKIINIASVLTFSGAFEVSAYTTSKGAIGQLTKALGNEWMQKGICVNALAPGYIETALTKNYPEERQRAILSRVPAGRWGQPEDLASAIIYLASKGRYVFIPRSNCFHKLGLQLDIFIKLIIIPPVTLLVGRFILWTVASVEDR